MKTLKDHFFLPKKLVKKAATREVKANYNYQSKSTLEETIRTCETKANSNILSQGSTMNSRNISNHSDIENQNDNRRLKRRRKHDVHDVHDVHDSTPSSINLINASSSQLSSSSFPLPSPSSPSLSLSQSCYTPKTAMLSTPQTPPSDETSCNSSIVNNEIPLTPPTPMDPLDDFFSTPASFKTPSSCASTTSGATTNKSTNSSPLNPPHSPAISTPSSLSHRKTKPNTKTQQLYLDFGQASFGKRTICPICNMLYVHGMKEDEEHHEKICNEYRFGVVFTKALWNYARIVHESSSGEEKCDYKDGEMKSLGHRSRKKMSKNNSATTSILNLFMAQQGQKQKRNRKQSTNTSPMQINRETDELTSKSKSSPVRNGCIIEVRNSDSMHLKKKVMKVKSIVDQELGFYHEISSNNHEDDNQGISFEGMGLLSSSPKTSTSSLSATATMVESHCNLGNKTVYLFIENNNKRVIGFCSVEVISKAYQLIQFSEEGNDADDDVDDADAIKQQTTSSTSESRATTTTSKSTTAPNLNRSMKAYKAMMGIHQLWCHKSYRNNQIASKLIDIARMKLVYGLNIPLDKVAFSSPTADGARFAKRYCCTKTPLVYDCK